MQNHERKHTSTAPRCDICNKSFTRKEHYINHSLWHNGTTPHQCSICNKKYTRKEHLANHMRSHTLVCSILVCHLLIVSTHTITSASINCCFPLGNTVSLPDLWKILYSQRAFHQPYTLAFRRNEPSM